MTDNPAVNRYLKDKAMDQIDHALGRPVHPLRESYRNCYAIDADFELARNFDASPHWEKFSQCGDMVYYGVTVAGRRALFEHLSSLATKWRAYALTIDGYTKIVPATTAGKARYSAFLDYSDSLPDLTFRDFCRLATVRRAA